MGVSSERGGRRVNRVLRWCGWGVWGAWGALLATGPVQAAPCPADAPRLHRLGPDQAWVAAAPAESDARNRGRTANQWLVRQGQRVWLLGAGPTPAAGRALACVLRAELGWRVTDVINPWARPEQTLGNRAFAQGPQPARLWAHADVAAAMARQCPRCEARLRQRLGPAAVDLGRQPIALPTHQLHGDQGELGPWHWWRLWRAQGGAQASAVLVLRLKAPAGAGPARWAAPGLLWGDGPPDLRDTQTPALQAAWQQLQTWAAADGHAAAGPAGGWDADAPTWLPEQGPWLGAGAPGQHLAYVAWLQQAVGQAQAAGRLETDAPPPWPQGPAYLGQGPRASLNWQRLWREQEAVLFAPAAAPSVEPGTEPSVEPGAQPGAEAGIQPSSVP